MSSIEPDNGNEVEEIYEIEEIPASDVDKLSAEAFLGNPCIRQYRRSLEVSPTPSILLDRQLRIQWANPSFRKKFGSLSRLPGIHLTIFFQEDFVDQRKRDLYQRVQSVDSGQCWYGRIEKKGVDSTSLITNLLILPLFPAGEDETSPIGFQGIFDDISGEYRQMLRHTYQSLLEAARLKDNDTGNHIERVNRYCRRITEVLRKSPDFPQVDQEFVDNISYLAAMHDVGKIGTPDDILNKAGKLEPWEWEIMKEHTINGAYIFSNYPNPMAKEIALRHHERWDGKGYPHGVSNTLIPLSARIVAIADVYDALRMRRAYKKPIPHDKAVAIVLKGKGSQFDPVLIEAFEETEADFKTIFQELEDPLETDKAQR